MSEDLDMRPSELDQRIEAAARTIFGFASPTRWSTASSHVQNEYRMRAVKVLDAADEAAATWRAGTWVT